MRLTVPISLRWSDFDAYAHVNNAEMFRLLEEARIQAFWINDDGSAGSSMAILVALIARQEIEYLLPIPYMRQPLDVELWIGRLGGASLEISYEVYSPEGQEPRLLYTRAATTLVMVELATGRPQRMTDEQRAAWEPFVEAPVAFAKRP
jgi:acyl-CoA thioester hydrolase